MSDALPLDPTAGPQRPEGAEAHLQVEDLLLIGLDHYFAGRYEQSIHVWTRVLFIDRGHARARAYIERARGALAERLRESEELLHHGVDAFHRGDASAARELLTTAVDRGAPADEALAVLGRLDRLEAGGLAPHTPVPRRQARRDAHPGAGPQVAPRRPVWIPVCVAVAVSLAAVTALGLTFGDEIGRWLLFEEVGRGDAVVTRADAPLLVPSASEVSLSRARALAGRIRLGEVEPSAADERLLREAMAHLEAIPPGDRLKAEADLLRARIQRALLAGVDRQVPGNSR